MKRAFIILFLLVIITSLFVSTNFVYADENSFENCFSYCVSDFNSGYVLFAKNEHKKHEIGSMVKIMTLNLFFEELENNTISLDEKIKVSAQAAAMGGSQMFLDANEEYLVEDLIKGIIIASANDAAFAIGERISGSIDKFVEKMNKKAIELGMNNTKYVNSSGLPSDSEQYSTAFDVNICTRNLMKHKDYHKYSKIWYEDFVHPSGRVTRLTNTNKLIKKYSNCICGKTGFTNDAGFCVSAGAKKDDFTVISTVIGSDSSDYRFKTAIDLFNKAFSVFSRKIVYKENEVIDTINVKKGKEDLANLYVNNEVGLLYKNNEPISSIEYLYEKSKNAPFDKDSCVGKISIKTGDYEENVNVYTCDAVDKKGFIDYFREILTKK